MAELAKLVSPDYIGWMRTSAQATQAQAPIIDSVAVGRSRYEQITYEVAEQIATIALDRPSARNGYTSQMADELADAFERAGEDDQVRVVVLTAVGADFCVGADLKDMSVSAAADGQDESAWLEPASRAVRPLFRLEKPVIAAVRGAAVGVGSTLLLPADFRIAATDCRFGFVFGRRGAYPEGGSAWFLPRLVGLGRAMDWMMSGRLVGAQEALAAGLVTELVDPDGVLHRAYELARDLISNVAPVSAAVIRQTMYRMSSLDSPDPVFALDSLLIASCITNPDTAEGILSFLERRLPEFTGRVSKDQPNFLPWRQ